MSAYWETALHVTLPILLAVAAGALLDRIRKLDSKSVADVGMLVLAPALVLAALVGSGPTRSEVLDVVLFTAVNMCMLWLLADLSATVFRLNKPDKASLRLTTVFSNAVNYGLPVCLLAFGQSGYAIAAMYVVGQSFLLFSLGIYFASSATRSGTLAFKEVWKTPVVYAAIIAATMSLLGWHWPTSIDNSLHVLSDAYPAVALIVLGIGLGRTHWRHGVAGKALPLAIILRIIAAPLTASLSIWMLGIHGQVASVLFVEASMPAAVNAAIFVEQYGGNRSLVAITVAITTAISFVMLPLLVMASHF